MKQLKEAEEDLPRELGILSASLSVLFELLEEMGEFFEEAEQYQPRITEAMALIDDVLVTMPA